MKVLLLALIDIFNVRIQSQTTTMWSARLPFARNNNSNKNFQSDTKATEILSRPKMMIIIIRDGSVRSLCSLLTCGRVGSCVECNCHFAGDAQIHDKYKNRLRYKLLSLFLLCELFCWWCSQRAHNHLAVYLLAGHRWYTASPAMWIKLHGRSVVGRFYI